MSQRSSLISFLRRNSASKLIWHIDLNYRINLPDADVRTLLSEASQHLGLTALLKFDQLNLAKRTKKAFENFVEPTIRHLPCVPILRST